MITVTEAKKNVENYKLGVVAMNTETAKKWCEGVSEKIARNSAEGYTYIYVSCGELKGDSRRIAETLLREAGFEVSYSAKENHYRISW